MKASEKSKILSMLFLAPMTSLTGAADLWEPPPPAATNSLTVAERGQTQPLRGDRSRAAAVGPGHHFAPGSLDGQSPPGGPSRQQMVHRSGSRPASLFPTKWTDDPESVPNHWRGLLPVLARGLSRRTRQKGVLKTTLRLPDGQVLNVWNVHLQDAGQVGVRRLQIDQLIARVHEAEDGQIADLVGGDFNSTPETPLYRELETALGPSVQTLGGIRPFVTWDGLSSKPGAGQTLDYIFVRPRVTLEQMRAVPEIAFFARNRRDRLSDHFGIAAEVNLAPASVLAKLPTPVPVSLPLPAAVPKRVSFGRSD